MIVLRLSDACHSASDLDKQHNYIKHKPHGVAGYQSGLTGSLK